MILVVAGGLSALLYTPEGDAVESCIASHQRQVGVVDGDCLTAEDAGVGEANLQYV